MKLILIYTIVLNSFFHSQDTVVTDLSRDNLKGKIKSIHHLNKGKSIKMVSYNTKGFYLEQKHYCPHDITKICLLNKYEYDQNSNLISLSDGSNFTKYKFDNDNNMVEQYSFSETGRKVFHRLINKYDNKKLISSKVYGYNQNIQIFSSKFENEYNDQGKIIKRIDYSYYERPNKPDTTLITETNYIYDDKGNLKEENKEKDGLILSSDTYEYDEKSRNLIFERYSIGGSQYNNYTEQNSYNSFDKIVKSIKTDIYGNEINKTEHDYDSDSNLIATRIYNRAGITTTTKYIYINNLLAEKVIYSKDVLSVKEYYKYDSFGNITSLKHIDSNGKLIHDFTYEIEYYH